MIRGMSRVSGRRHRHTASVPRVTLGVSISRTVRDQINQACAAAGVSQILYVEQLIERDLVDGDGRPQWAADLSAPALIPAASRQAPPPRRGPVVQLTGLIAPELHAKATAAATSLWPLSRSGRPQIGRYLEQLVARDHLDHRGVPTWLPVHLESQEALQLTMTA